MDDVYQDSKGFLDEMNLEKFRMWSQMALKTFLSVRNKSVEGNHDELASRAFISWEENVLVNSSKEQQLMCNLEDYKSKLRIRGCVIPDPFSLKSGWLSETAMQFWPDIYITDIAEYFRLKTPEELWIRLLNEYKQGKAFRYFTSGWVKEVLFHDISDTSDVCLLSSKVTPSMCLSAKPHQVWMAIEKNSKKAPGGRIHSAYCTCTAGLLGTCNHIAAVLFRVECAVTQGLTKPSCTSQLCQWNVPATFQPSKPIKLCEQRWQKDQYFKENTDSFHDSVYERANNFNPMNDDQVHYVEHKIEQQLQSILRVELPQCSYMQMCDSVPFTPVEIIKCPEPLIDTARDLAIGGDDSVDELLQQTKLSENDIKAIETATILQTFSDEWHRQRKGRITASNFARVKSKMQNLEKYPDTSSLTKHIVGVQTTPQTAAMKYGNALESKAKRVYSKIMRKSHNKFKCYDTGLCIHKDFQYLGASPDLIVECKCHGVGLCEIKCPYSVRDQVPTHLNYKHIIEGTNGPTLDKKSTYYAQIQGQMGICNKNYCDIFMYTTHGYHLERIELDLTYWEALLELLNNFWLKFVAPALLKGSFSLFCHPVSQDVSSKLDHSYVENEHQNSGATDFSKAKTIVNSTCTSILTNPKFPIILLCGKCGYEIREPYAKCTGCAKPYHKMCINSKFCISWKCSDCV